MCEALLPHTMLQVLIEEEENVTLEGGKKRHFNSSSVLFALLSFSTLNPSPLNPIQLLSMLVYNYRWGYNYKASDF